MNNYLPKILKIKEYLIIVYTNANKNTNRTMKKQEM